MKKIIVFCAAAACMLSACDQTRLDIVDQSKTFDGTGSITVSLSSTPSTKSQQDASRNVDYELRINETQVFIFKNADNDASRRAQIQYRTENFTGDQLKGDGSNKQTITGLLAKAGGTNYYVVALSNFKGKDPNVNGTDNLKDVTTRNVLEDKVVDLTMHDVTANSGSFPMIGIVENDQRGESAVNVLPGNGNDPTSSTASAAPAPVKLRRFVSRVHLGKVKNEIPQAYGKLIVDNVFMINAYGSWRLGADLNGYSGELGVANKFNWGGEDNGTIVGVNSTTGKNAPQAFWAPNVSIENGSDSGTNLNHDFYVMPNPFPKDGADAFSGAISSNTDARTRMVIEAHFQNDTRNDGQPVHFYYPVTITGAENAPMLRNTAYNVDVTIRNEGSRHPNDEPLYGNVEVSVTVQNWDDGGQIEKNF